MIARKTVLIGITSLFLAGIFATFGTGAWASHIPQSLIDAVFYEFENDWCQKDPECSYPAYESGGEYETCMKFFLHDYTEAELERILRFKNQNGYFLETDLDDYDWLIEEWAWIGC